MIPPHSHDDPPTEIEARLLRTARSYRASDTLRRSTLEAVNAAAATDAAGAATKGTSAPLRQMLSSPKLALGVLALGVGFATLASLPTGLTTETGEARETSATSQRQLVEPPERESVEASSGVGLGRVAAPSAPAVPTVSLAEVAAAPASPVGTSARANRPKVTPVAGGMRVADVAGSSPTAAAARAPSDSLTDEIAAVDKARRALKRKDPIAALDALDAHRQRFPSGTLHPEATALRVEALLARGDDAEARVLAETFLADHPTSPLGPRVRSLIGATKD